MSSKAASAVSVSGLGKSYRIYDKPRHRLWQGLGLSRAPLYREFWALRDVSFQLNRGETLGVVGRNGSGKSTLLQLICSTLTPTTGNVEVRGRIGALLELGSGFHPDFTGLENVALNAALLGLSQAELNERLPSILAFAEIGDFASQPVKTYSSGMAVRLAFAVQAHVDPDILVVDEALAVGDERFQKKCYAHLQKLKARGTSILLVSHTASHILQHCDRALLLHQGELQCMDEPRQVMRAYQKLCNAEQPDTTSITALSQAYPERGAQIQQVQLLDAHGEPCQQLDRQQPFSIEVHYGFTAALNDLEFGCTLSNHTGLPISGQLFPPEPHGTAIAAQPGSTHRLRFHFRGGLLPGVYFVTTGLWHRDQPEQFLHRVTDVLQFRVLHDPAQRSYGLCDLSDQPALWS